MCARQLAEKVGRGHCGRAGKWKHHSIADRQMTLCVLGEQSMAGDPLFCCFVNFQITCFSVPRQGMGKIGRNWQPCLPATKELEDVIAKLPTRENPHSKTVQQLL